MKIYPCALAAIQGSFLAWMSSAESTSADAIFPQVDVVENTVIEGNGGGSGRGHVLTSQGDRRRVTRKRNLSNTGSTGAHYGSSHMAHQFEKEWNAVVNPGANEENDQSARVSKREDSSEELLETSMSMSEDKLREGHRGHTKNLQWAESHFESANNSTLLYGSVKSGKTSKSGKSSKGSKGSIGDSSMSSSMPHEIEFTSSTSSTSTSSTAASAESSSTASAGSTTTLAALDTTQGATTTQAATTTITTTNTTATTTTSTTSMAATTPMATTTAASTTTASSATSMTSSTSSSSTTITNATDSTSTIASTGETTTSATTTAASDTIASTTAMAAVTSLPDMIASTTVSGSLPDTTTSTTASMPGTDSTEMAGIPPSTPATPSVDSPSQSPNSNSSSGPTTLATSSASTSPSCVPFQFEDFESGEFPIPPWTTTGGEGEGAGWAVDSSNAYEGTYSLKSPTLTGGFQTSNATLTLCEEFEGGFLTMQVIASVVPPTDLMDVVVDGLSTTQLADINEWTEISLGALPPGAHTIDFVYRYNVFDLDQLPPSSPDRLGAVWIDNVQISPMSQMTEMSLRTYQKMQMDMAETAAKAEGGNGAHDLGSTFTGLSVFVVGLISCGYLML